MVRMLERPTATYMKTSIIGRRASPAMAALAAMFLTILAVAHPVVSTGLQVYYPFNGNTTDQSGNGLALNLSGASLSTDRFGIPNQALAFSGNVANASFNYSLAGQSFSIGGWFYQPVYSLTEAGGFAQGSIGSSGLAFRLMTDYGSENNLRFSFWFNDFDYSLAGRDRSKWVHLFATFDNATLTRKIYINGALVATSAAEYGFSGTGPLQFGFMTGSMDEIRVYNRAITDAEVSQIYLSELQQNPNAECEELVAELAAEVEILNSENAALRGQQTQANAGLEEIWRLLELPPGQRSSSANFTGPLGPKINQIIRALTAPPGKTSSNGK